MHVSVWGCDALRHKVGSRLVKVSATRARTTTTNNLPVISMRTAKSGVVAEPFDSTQIAEWVRLGCSTTSGCIDSARLLRTNGCMTECSSRSCVTRYLSQVSIPMGPIEVDMSPQLRIQSAPAWAKN